MAPTSRWDFETRVRAKVQKMHGQDCLRVLVSLAPSLSALKFPHTRISLCMQLARASFRAFPSYQHGMQRLHQAQFLSLLLLQSTQVVVLLNSIWQV